MKCVGVYLASIKIFLELFESFFPDCIDFILLIIFLHHFLIHPLVDIWLVFFFLHDLVVDKLFLYNYLFYLIFFLFKRFILVVHRLIFSTKQLPSNSWLLNLLKTHLFMMLNLLRHECLSVCWHALDIALPVMRSLSEHLWLLF